MDAGETLKQAPFQPIGYWLKHLDNLIEQSFDRCLAEQDLSRRHWQILNLLDQRPAFDPELTEALQPFVAAGDGSPLDAVTDELARREWVGRDLDGRYALTPEGKTVHADVARRVIANRLRTMNGLTQYEYRQALEVLQRMAQNLTE